MSSDLTVGLNDGSGGFAAPTGPSLEWDDHENVLVLTDPYLLFYLRWSGILESESESD